MRFGKLCVKLRPMRLVRSQPFGWMTKSYGWSIAVLSIAVSWIDIRKMSAELDEAFKGLD
jgi:hypothetical protein